MTIASRLDALERQRRRTGNGPEIIMVHGGFGGEMTQATAGAFAFTRLDGETLADFTGRTLAAAREAREPFLIIGGLPDGALISAGPESSLPNPLAS